MYPKSNLHTHTTFCDGKISPAEMVDTAIEKGLVTLGFSGHAQMIGHGERWCMSETGTQAYRAAVRAIARERADEIEIALGVEQDIFAISSTEGYDYVIGAVHMVRKDGDEAPVDSSPDELDRGVREMYNGDIYALIEDFYRLSAEAPRATGADIAAHFDLVRKFNKDGARFDECDKRYRDAAMTALNEAAKSDVIFEINTGGKYRVGCDLYPSRELLTELKSIGGRITFSSDSHDARSLCYKFDEAKRLAKSCGFKTAWTWSGGGFKEFKI